MTGFEIDDFALSLLEESKRFLEKVEDHGDHFANEAYLHSALLLAFSSLEAQVNAIAEEFVARPELSVHEKGMILEQEVRLENGEFVRRPVLRMARLEDRISFLYVKFGRSIDRSMPHWSRLADAVILRNQLTHPKEKVTLTKAGVGRAIQAVVDTLDAMCQAIYKRPFPAAGRGLQSSLSF